MLLFTLLTGIAPIPSAHAAVGGTVLWQIRDSKAGVQMPTVPTGSAVDASGNIYITGYQNLINGTSGEDFYTIKLTPIAEAPWVAVDTTWGSKTYNEANENDRATSIAIDSDNNVIVAGNVTMGDGSKHIHIVKYSGTNTGEVLWEHTYAPTTPVAHSYDMVTSIAISGNNVYVAGLARISGNTNDDILILKYDNTKTGDNPPVKAVVYDHAAAQDDSAFIAANDYGVAVIGKTWDGAEFDMLTLKYDLDLTDATKKIWQHSSPGGNTAGNNGSWGRYVKIDPDGNVIASGFDISASSDKDIYTAKYCDNATPATCNGVAQGTMAWERRYQGSFADDVKDLAVDANKDVFITGITSVISSSTDFYTAKYNGGDGTLAWEAKTDGGSIIDMANALVVDNSGEVYVTGYAKQNGFDTIQTMKYRKNATTGRLLWQQTFKNPDFPDMLDIRGTGIGLSTGGVVVTGWASKLSTPNLDSGSATGGSVTTLQDTSKTWTSSQYANYYLKITETNPTAGTNKGQIRLITATGSDETLTVSPGFPVAVSAGDSYEIYSLDTDYYALKYEKGTLDRPTDLSAATLSNSSVRLAWVDNSSTETGFKLERCKGKGCDFSVLDATITLNADITSYDDTDAKNTTNGTPKLDPDSYYYYRVKAYTDIPAENSDYSNSVRAVTVFLSYPMPLAANIFTYNGPGNQEDTSPAVAVGPDNNPVVTGRSNIWDDDRYTFDYYTIKLDRAKLSLPAGILWSAKYDGGQADNDEATCLAVDKDNKVIVSGDSILPPIGGGSNMNVLMTLKYLNPPEVDGLNNPTHSWYDKYNGTGKLDDHATTVATDASGNFVVVGHGKKDNGNHQEIYVVKYNADNSRAWAGDLYDAGENGKPAAVVFGADGNIFVTGQQNAGTALTPNFNFLTIKYCGNSDPAKCNGKTPGKIIWSHVYDSTRGNDHAEAMTIDSSNNIYVTGTAVNSAGNQDFYTIKFDGAINTETPDRILWSGKGLSVDGSESGEAVAARIDIVSGDLLVAGTVLSDPDNHDFALIRYKANGDLIKKKVLLRPDNDDYAINMALDASGNAFVAGNTSNGNGTASMTIQFDSDSNVIQSMIYNASTAQEDLTTNIAVNAKNEAFVVGTTRQASTDYLLYKMPVWPVQAPAPVTITPGYTTLDFAWPATSTATGVSYKGKRADGACSDISVFGAEFAIPANSYSASGLPQNTSYCYAFKTITATSGDSRWVPVTVTTLDPAAPILNVTPTNTTQIDLTWTTTTTGQSGFEVWRCADSTSTACSNFALLTTTLSTATGYSDQAVCPGTIYRYQVRAVGAGWSSAFSAIMGAIPPSVDNIFADPGIEAPNPMAVDQAVGWTYANAFVISEITFDALVQHGIGGQSLNVNAVTTASYEGIKQYVRFSPGGRYQLSAWFKTNAPAGKVACDSLDGSSFLITNSGSSAGEWEQVFQTLTVPSPSASSRVRCYVYQGYQANIDDVQVKPLYDLTATAYSESQINLVWLDSAYDETGYEIWRCKDGGTACTDFALVDKVGANITIYGSSGLEPNAIYRFQIRPYKTAPASCGGGWTGAFSNIAGPTQALYSKPALSKTTPNTTQLNLSWVDTTSSESSFLLQRCSGSGCTFDAGHSLVETSLPLALGKDTTQAWSDTSVCTSTDYQYRVKPVNNGIQSASGCWNKSTSLNISNFKADFITRVKILGSTAGYTGMKADFSDIRIYDETAKKELPYWIEAKSDTNWAIVWFKTGTSSNIKLYYDNSAAAGTGNLSAVFGSGVMAFFPFGEAAASSGTTYDLSGLGNNLGLNYTAGYGLADPGAFKLGPDSGNALSTSGANSRYAGKSGTNLPSGGTATIEAWIYPKSPQTNGLYNGIVSFGENLQAQRVYLSLQDNGRPAMLGFNNDFVPATGPQATFNAWNHIAVVLNNTTTATLYMNGIPVSGTLSGNLKPILNGVQYLRVGVDNDYRAFNGFIDDVRIYNRELLAADIAMRYAPVLPSVTVGAASGSSSCQTFSGSWGDDTFYSTTLPVAMAAPVPPTTLNAVANNEAKVTLTWTNKTSDQTGFKVFRCAGSSCSFAGTPDYTIANTAAVNTTVTHVDTTGLVPGTLYKYKVQAYKTGVSCPWDSAADTAPTNNTVTMPLNAPTGLFKAYSVSTTCKDLRFTDSGGNAVIDHWLESGCNTASTRVWLKVPSLTVGANTVYLHYANPGAAAPAQPVLHTGFFEFYDDFAGTTLDTSKWTKVQKTTSTITQNNGLSFNYATGTWGDTGLYSNTSFARPFVLEFTHYRTANDQAMFGAVNKPDATPYNSLSYPNFAHAIFPYYQDYNALGYRILAYENGTNKGDSLKSLGYNVWNYYKLDVKTTGANYWHADSPTAAYTALTPTTASSGSTTPLYIGMVQYTQNFLVSWVRVRKYASTEPTYTLLAEQLGQFALTGGTWGIKRPITITNATAATLSNYQMPITIDTLPLAWDQIKVNWTNSTASEEGYIIERCDNTAHGNTCATTFVADKSITVPGNGVTSYFDGDIKSNNAYCYRVKASRTTAPAWTTAASSVICETAHQQQAPVLSAVGTTTQIKLDWTEADYASDSGTATYSNVTTYLNDTSKTWGTNQWAGYYLKIITSATPGNVGASKLITSNTNNKITVASAFSGNIMTGNSYQIVPADGNGNMLSGIIGEYGYEIERCNGAVCTPTSADKITALPYNNARTYIDPLCSGIYNYRLRLVKYGSYGTPLTAAADAWPDYSNTVSANITSAPAPAKVKAARVSEAQISLTWQDNTGDETGFNIYRCKDVGGSVCTNFTLLTTAPAATGTASGSPAGTGTTVTYNDTKDIAQDSTYRYQVKATGTGAICPTWESLAGTPDTSYVSGEARATTTNAAPSDLNVQAGNTTQANVSWNDNTASEGSIILERCTGVGCTDFSYLNNISNSAPAKQYRAFYPFAVDAKDTSGNGLDLGRTPVLNIATGTYYDPTFNDGFYLNHSYQDSFQSPVSSILDTDTHAIEFDFKIREYMSSRGKVFGYTVATATPDKSSPGIYVAASGSGYGLGWTYLDNSGGSTEIHIGVNGIGDASGAFVVNQWYHIRGEKSGNSFKLYVDGTLKGSTAVPSPQQTGNFPLTFGRDASSTEYPAKINLKNFGIDGNVMFTDSSECAGETYSYRTRAVRDGFVSSNVTVANFQANTPTRVVVPASIVAGRTMSQINDLRFYDYTAKADIPYWIESVLSDGTAVAWIKSTNSTITLYANKNATGAISASSASGVYGSGLVGYWPFNEAIGTTTGSASVDASGKGMNGTLTGGASIIAGGKFGNGLNLNGTSGYLNIPVSSGSSLDLNGSTTIEFWYYYNATLTDAENSCKPLLNRGYDDVPGTNRKFNLYLGCTNTVTSSGSATADSSDNTTLTNASGGWTTNSVVTSKLTMNSGNNIGQSAYITGNTATVLTFYPPFTNAVRSTDAYTISPYITNTNRTVNFSVSDSSASHLQFRADYGGQIPPLTNNSWNHIVARYDAAQPKISVIINGAESNGNTTLPSGFTSLGASAQPLRIGVTSNLTGFHKGSIDEVRIYNRALSDPEIAAHYAAAPPSGTVDATVAFPTGLAAWKASTPVLIAGFQPNYQTRLTVTKAALMNNDFSDLRFYDTTAQAELQYWIESKTDGASASLWIKTGATNTIAMYYGNSNATSISNAAAVFEFFDDFNTLEVANWSKSDPAADITVDGSGNGTVRINGGALVSVNPVVSNPQNYTFEMKSYLLAPTNVWYTGLSVVNAKSVVSGNGESKAVAKIQINNVVGAVGADGTTASNNLTGATIDGNIADYIGASNAKVVGIEFPGSAPIRFFSRNSDTYVDKVAPVVASGTWQAADKNAYLYLGHVFGLNGLAIDTTDLVVDWVRARKYAYPEPQATVNTGQFPGNLNPGSGGSGSWAAGLLLNINNFQPNFPTMMTVNWRNGMKTDFSDIRFYDTTAKIELPYWVERYTASSTATVWLKPGSNKTIAMYYGNNLATSASNGVNVFEFFDDFATLDTTKWSKSDAAAGITVDGTGTGKLRINTGAIYSNLPLVSSPQNWVYEMKSQWTGTVTNYSQLTVSDSKYFTSGNGGASAYATNRLQNTGSLYAQASDGTAATNNVATEAYPVAASPYSMAPLNTDSIVGLEFQGDTGKISFFSKNPATYADLARVSKDAVITVYDPNQNWTGKFTYGGGSYVNITSGLNKGLSRQFGPSSYTSTAISVAALPNFFSTGDTYEIYNNNYANLLSSGSLTNKWNAPSYLWLGSYLGSGKYTASGGTADNTDLIVDWVRIRKYANPMPSVTMDAINVNQAPAPDIYQFLNNWASPYSATITVATPQVANLASNSDFENGTDKWTVGAGASTDITTTISGLKSLKLSKSLIANTSELASLPLPQLLPGGSYTLSGNIKASLTNGNAFCRLAINNATWDNPGVGAPEFDIFNSSPKITWNKINNSIPASSNSASTDGAIPLGISSGGAGHAVSPYGTPTDKGDTGAVQGAAVIKEDATQYRMWYSGNDHGVSGSWRIYYATSANGVTWNKVDTTLPPVQDTGTVPVNSNGRLGLGNDVAGIGDRFHVYVSPAVIKDVDTDGSTTLYKMWYSGHDRTNWRIYYATSPDGLNWTKYDNTVEAANNLTGTRGRIPLGSGTVGDKSHTYAPTVVKDTSTNPATYKMWYSGSDGSRWRVFYATSTDGGLTWTKKNNVASAARDLTTPNDNTGQIPEGTALKADDFYAYMPHVIAEGSTYKMWYTGLNVSGYNDPATRINRVLYATSTDGGLNWTKQNNAQPSFIDSPATTSSSQLPNGSAFTGDSFGPIASFVLREAANTYTMWYSGLGGNIPQIYRATTTNGGSTWTKQDNSSPARSDLAGTNGRIPRGVATKGDTFHTSWPSIIKESESSYKMWYNATDGLNWRIYYATSSDGLSWSKLDNTIPAMSDTTGTNGRLGFGSGGKGDSLGVLSPSVAKDTFEPDANQRYKMWYTGHDGFTWRGIFMATSPDGLTWTKKDNSTFVTYQNTGTGPGGGRLFTGQDVTTPAIGDNRQVRTGSGSVVWDGGQNYKMWYSGNNGYWRIFMATSTDGGLTWNKVNNVVTANRDSGVTPTDSSGQIPLGSAGKGDSSATFMPTVYKDGSTYRMWYAGSDGANWRIYYATSTDGYNWTKYDNSVPTAASDGVTTNGRIALGSTGKGDGSHIQGVTVINDESTPRMWYTGFDQSTPQRQRILSAVQAITPGGSNNDNLWHSFSLPITLKPTLSTADAANLRILCGISRDGSGTDSLIDTANFDMLQLVPDNLSAFNLTATKFSESQINLAWSDMTTDESGYKIWRCKDPDQTTACIDFGASPFATVAAGVTSFQDAQSLQPNTTYRYKVSAYKAAPGSCNGGWDSSFSNIAFAKTDDAAPASLKANAVNTNQVDLSWIDKSTGESGFAIERSTDGTSFSSLPPDTTKATLAMPNATTFSDTTACPSTTYTYRVRALNRGLSLDGGFADNCTDNYSWDKRKHLTITNFQPQYQISLNVTYVAGMKTDFSDLRFFDATVGKELPYWIESKTNSVSATVWLKTGDNNDIDMYYGNTNAANAGNPAKVFDFYEDFTGNAIDTAKWTVVNASGLSVSGGNLRGTNTSGQIKSIATFPAGKTLEYKAKAAKWADNPWYIGGFSAPWKYLGWVAYYNEWQAVYKPNDSSGRGLSYYTTGGTYNAALSTNFPSKNDIMSTNNMLYRVTAKDAGNVAMHIDALDRLDAQGKPLVLTDMANAGFVYADAPIVIGGSVANPGEAMQVDWDWVRVRKYVAFEPVVTQDAEVVSSSLSPSQTCFSFANQWGDEVAGTRYYSSNSNPVKTPTPFVPSNVTAYEVTPTRIDLTWADNTGSEETGFEIQDCGLNCTNTSAPPVAVAANSTKYSFTGLTAGTDHCYRVRAAKSGACGWPTDYSAAACVTLSNTIHLDAIAQGPFAVKLDWNNVPDDERGFEIEKKLANGNFTNIATVGNVLTYNDKVGVEPLKQYTYRVRKAGHVDDFIGGINTMTWTPEVGSNYRQKLGFVALSGNILDSAYTAIQDTSLEGGLNKNSWTNLQWLNCPVLISSGGSTLLGTVAGNTNSVFFVTPALTTPITTSDTYRILNTVSGTATSGTTGQLSDAFKNWKTSQWAGTPHYLKIVSSVNSANMGQVRKITSNATTSFTIDTTSPALPFPSAIVAGDTYQVGSDFGTATPGSTATLLTDNTKSWSTDWTAGYYMVMTSGNNNGQVRQITGYTATTLTVTPAFDSPIATNDTYLIAATGVNGTVSAAVATGGAQGAAKLSASGAMVEFSSVSPGVGQNYNYEMATLNDLTPLSGDFDMQTDYAIPALPGLIPSDSTSNNTNFYACLRYQFSLASFSYQYQPVMCRGRVPITYNGMATSGTTTSLTDTRVMAGTTTPWKNWGINQWAGQYLQMTNGANNLLVRKIVGNTANSITLDSAFPSTVALNDKYRINVIGGTAASSGNSNTLLVDGATGAANSPVKDWTSGQWTGFQLKMTSGPNIGQVRPITGNTATTITVSPPFASPIGNYAGGGDSYQIFDTGETAKAKEYYFLGINEAQYNIVEQQYFLTSDTSGSFRIAKSGNSIKFYTSSTDGEWDLLRQLDLPDGKTTTPTLLGMYQLGSLSEPAGTNMKAQFDNFQLTPLSSHGVLGAGNNNPYSNEATVTYTYPNDFPVPSLRNTTISTTPVFTTGDGNCTCVVQANGTTVCTQGLVTP